MFPAALPCQNHGSGRLASESPASAGQPSVTTQGEKTRSTLKIRWCGVFAMLLAVVWFLPTAAVVDGEAAEEAAKPTVFRTASIIRGDLAVMVDAVGTLEPEQVVDVGSAVAGRVESLSGDYGSRVEKGDILARIDDWPFAAQVEQRGQLVCGPRPICAGSAALELTDLQGKRDAELAKKQALSPSDLDFAAASLKLAKAGVAVAEASVAQSEAGLKQAELNLGYTVIRSPVKGVVIDRRVNVGLAVVPGGMVSACS